MIVRKSNVKQRRTPFDGTLLLRSKEIMYLRLYALGENDKDIVTFLGISKRYLNSMKLQIEKKFESKHWLKIIARALELDLLKLSDFAEEVMKKEALICTDGILGLSYENKPIPNAILKSKLNAFCNAQKKKLQLKYLNENQKLDTNSIQFLNLKYKSQVIEEVAEKEYIIKNTNNALEDKLFTALEVKNWMSALRKGVMLDLIVYVNETKSDVYSKLQIKQSSGYLNRLLYFEDLSQIEKKQIIYEKLVNLNLNIELYKLFSGFQIRK